MVLTSQHPLFLAFANVSVQFEARLPPRKFRHYKCVGPAAAALERKLPRVSHDEVVWANPKAATETAVNVA